MLKCSASTTMARPLQRHHGSRSRSRPRVRRGGHRRSVNATHRPPPCPGHSAQSRNTDTATRTGIAQHASLPTAGGAPPVYVAPRAAESPASTAPPPPPNRAHGKYAGSRERPSRRRGTTPRRGPIPHSRIFFRSCWRVVQNEAYFFQCLLQATSFSRLK